MFYNPWPCCKCIYEDSCKYSPLFFQRKERRKKKKEEFLQHDITAHVDIIIKYVYSTFKSQFIIFSGSCWLRICKTQSHGTHLHIDDV